MVEEIVFKGTNAVKLENDILMILILPEIGGKIASIYRKDKRFELLFQNQKGIYNKAKLGDSFADYDASGFDDAFPTINKCVVEYGGKEIVYPDHGEVWSSKFDFKVDGEKIRLCFMSSILPYRYDKTIWLENEKLKVYYSIKNLSNKAFPCIWAMHCLVNCEEDMIINFPQDTKEIVNVQKSIRLGEVGTVHTYPVTKALNGELYRLDRVLPATSNNTEKYYVNGKVSTGNCSIYYPSKNMLYEIKFDKEKLPYLGFWVTEGGFRGDYNCAFEPTNAYYDSIDIASKNNKLGFINGNEKFELDIEISLK